MNVFKIAMAAGLASSMALAAEPGHEGHGIAAPAPPSSLIDAAPPSGKARESGFDGNDMMESTGVDNVASVQCAQAARGIIMLDRAASANCGAAPAEAAPAAPPAAAPPTEHQHHH
jgi:hypothetical protein